MPATVVFDVADQVQVVLDDNASLLTATWLHWGDHHTFANCLDVQADLVEAGRARYAIVDIQSATGAPSAMDRDYVHRFVFPRFRHGGLRAIVIVRPDSGHTREGTSTWAHNGAVWRFDMHQATSPAEARQLVQALHERDASSLGAGARVVHERPDSA